MKKENDNIVLSTDEFEHLLNCLDNQKYINTINADGLATSNYKKIQHDMQECIDAFNVKCREVLHRQGVNKESCPTKSFIAWHPEQGPALFTLNADYFACIFNLMLTYDLNIKPETALNDFARTAQVEGWKIKEVTELVFKE